MDKFQWSHASRREPGEFIESLIKLWSDHQVLLKERDELRAERDILDSQLRLLKHDLETARRTIRLQIGGHE